MANIQYYDVILKPVVTEKMYERYEREKTILSWFIRKQTNL